MITAFVFWLFVISATANFVVQCKSSKKQKKTRTVKSDGGDKEEGGEEGAGKPNDQKSPAKG
jgi:hypothetical protein